MQRTIDRLRSMPDTLAAEDEAVKKIAPDQNPTAAGSADVLVGGDTQSGDCLARQPARTLAPDAVNREINGVPGGPPNLDPHGNFPHHLPPVCTALRTIGDHQVPADQAAACMGLTQ